MGFLKFSLFVMNTICLMCSLVLVGTGAYMQVKSRQYGDNLHIVWYAVPITVIAIGVIVLIVSFLGCCGAIKENVYMLYLYSFLLIVLLVAELAVSIIAFVYRQEIDKGLEKSMTSAINNSTKEVTVFMDLVQSSFQCCGVKGPKDYIEGAPQSCKKEKTVFNEGCVSVFAAFLKRNLIIIGLVAFGVCFLQLLTAIITWFMVHQIKEYEIV
ncbi:unnamed protein product [Schistosoma rodhaini]|uniref:Tetraspanin n=1 Tax=Schistosoma rodhaini TaxID=6188 RepID=A0AA85ETP8_9TREM|nr:unnamed protein product [Schistosoma rodhaini]CAH8493093.1 unnamed protein product [Schistosoma rodhaini]